MKNKKIVLFIALIIAILLIAFVLSLELINKKESINHKDLVCTRSSDFIDLQDETIITIHFDKTGIINNYITQNSLSFSEEQEAIDYYNQMLSTDFKGEVKISKNIVISQFTEKITENNNFYGKNRQQVREIFANELFYDCGE